MDVEHQIISAHMLTTGDFILRAGNTGWIIFLCVSRTEHKEHS